MFYCDNDGNDLSASSVSLFASSGFISFNIINKYILELIKQFVRDGMWTRISLAQVLCC